MLAVANGESRSAGNGGRLLQWLDDHFAMAFGGLLVGSLSVAILLRKLRATGKGRGVALAFFGLLLVGGIAELFAAGVAVGLGRPNDAWLTMLGCAVILIFVAVQNPRGISQFYAGIELRKMRALEVA